MVKKNQIATVAFSAVLLVGVMASCICDMAISGELTWSLISLSSIIFVWLTVLPIVMRGKRGIILSLLSVTILILPYLYLLSGFVSVRRVFSVGAVMAIISVPYLWIVFALIKYMGAKKMQTYGIVLLSAIPFLVGINAALSRLVAEPLMDGWDIFTIILLLMVSIPLLVLGYSQNKRAVSGSGLQKG